ncbi:hypothetical protein AS850_03375 [Frondihabitans sp. 762G35]|uniref:thioredoxin domain-containing protein n=1 Tax=Frondihabitans sp. 762G35 TaxID=1446794 RepID=UPI000D20F879|nr:DUF255 domain-containing protein [Frondihabitans sp. 762G35]ARC56115.1 hypothetical protein AS850_03375 [Frondihabitans sp. 762G35]
MSNALADAVSPYLRSHADNPVDWREWGPEPFEEARRRGVPVMISIGYSTCHWCHVMARETFSDEVVAARLNGAVVAIKVDREEHPDVDSSYLAAASAFTGNLGWPLTVFATPEGRAFYAGTYYPPVPVRGQPSFTQVLDAVLNAWTERRDEVEQNAAEIAAALAAGAPDAQESPGRLPTPADLDSVVRLLAAHEDPDHGGFGAAPKFPVAPVLLFLLQGAGGAGGVARDLADRTLLALAASPLRDPVEGGFFRYSVRRDWSEPHYERMLYDNAQLLTAFSRLGAVAPAHRAEASGIAAGVADFLLQVLRRPEGGFGSAQDSESTVAGGRTEGGYYALTADERRAETPPAVDDKVLTGWNGLAIGALAEAGARQGRSDWVEAARVAADRILRHHRTPDGRLLRAATSDRVSSAVATLEDYGMLAQGLLRLALATGRVSYAVEARALCDACLGDGAGAGGVDDDRRPAFRVPGGTDPVLARHGLALPADPSEGAYPSGLSALAGAAFLLAQLTADRRYRDAATTAISSVTTQALDSPIGFGAALALAADLAAEATQLVVVTRGAEATGDVAEVARTLVRPGAVAAVVTAEQAADWAAAGFELFEGRTASTDADLAYLCRDFVCRLPVTTAAELEAQLLPA